MQHISLDRGRLTTRATEQFPSWYWWTSDVCLSLPFLQLSGTGLVSFLETTSELWRALWPMANLGCDVTKFQLQIMTGGLEINYKEGWQVTTSNSVGLSSLYLLSSFPVQWKVSWTSQEFSEVGNTEKKTVNLILKSRKMFIIVFFLSMRLIFCTSSGSYLCFSALNTLLTDLNVMPVTEALSPHFHHSSTKNCMLAAIFIFLPSIHICCIYQDRNSSTDWGFRFCNHNQVKYCFCNCSLSLNYGLWKWIGITLSAFQYTTLVLTHGIPCCSQRTRTSLKKQVPHLWGLILIPQGIAQNVLLGSSGTT